MSLPSTLRASLHTLTDLTPGEQAVLFKLMMRSDVEQYLVEQYEIFLKQQKLTDSPESQTSFQQSRVFRGLVDRLMESLQEEIGDEQTEKRLKLMAMLHEIERGRRGPQKPLARGLDWLKETFRNSDFFAEHIAKDDGFTVRYEQLLHKHSDILVEKVGEHCGTIIKEETAAIEKAAAAAAARSNEPMIDRAPQAQRLKDVEQHMARKGPEIG